jgi:hypothetical protein
VVGFVEDGEHAEIVFVEEFEDVLFAGVGGDADERLGFQMGHVLFGCSEKHARDGNGAGELGASIEQDDGVELFEVEILIAHPLENFFASGFFADISVVRVHHAAGGGGIEGEEMTGFASFLIGHFLEDFLGGFFGKIGEEIGRGIRSHFFENVGGFFGVKFFDDLGGEAFVKFRKDSGGGFFVERSDDALAFGGREFFHHFCEIGGVQILEFFVGDTEFHAAKRIGLDEIDEFPADGALGEFGLESADQRGRSDSLQKTADCAGQADVHLSDAQLDMIVGAKFGEVDVVYANDLAAFGVDDLLIEKIFANGEPRFVGLVGFEGAFGDVEIDAAGDDFFDLIVAGDERLEAAAGNQEVGDAIGLFGRFDEEFAHTADKVGLRVVDGGGHEFGGEEHWHPFWLGQSRIAANLRKRATQEHSQEWLCHKNQTREKARTRKSRATQEPT